MRGGSLSLWSTRGKNNLRTHFIFELKNHLFIVFLIYFYSYPSHLNLWITQIERECDNHYLTGFWNQILVGTILFLSLYYLARPVHLRCGQPTFFKFVELIMWIIISDSTSNDKPKNTPTSVFDAMSTNKRSPSTSQNESNVLWGNKSVWLWILKMKWKDLTM